MQNDNEHLAAASIERDLLESRLETRRSFFVKMGTHHQFQQLFDDLPGVYFFVKDDRSRMMGASHGILERFGLSREEDLIGRTDYDFFPRHIADNFVRDDRQVLRTGQPLTGRVEIWYTEQRLLDWFVTNKRPVRAQDGSIIGVMGTVRSYEGHRRSAMPYTQISEVVDYIRDNHRGRITVAELATRAGLSSRQLHRKFHEVFRMSVQDFLTKTRIQAASDALLRTDEPIVDIAQRFGFCDQSAFTQQFRRHTGLTPLRFRRAHRTARMP